MFHSERDLQHALAWQIQLRHADAHLRLEPRPRRNIHLDLLVSQGQRRTAIELKYLLAGFHGEVDGEVFDLPNQSAQDISRHDVIKDLTRVEAVLEEGYADHGFTVTLTNDGNYWRPGPSPDPIDAAFRIHEGRVLEGALAWAAHAGRGTTSGRDAPLTLTGLYHCSWRTYSQIAGSNGRPTEFRYLLLAIATGTSTSTPAVEIRRVPAAAPVPAPRVASPSGPGTARAEILAVARGLAVRSTDGSFTVVQILTEMGRSGSRYAESTIRTHVTSRMCANAPDHHAKTFDDFDRVGAGVYRLRARPRSRAGGVRDVRSPGGLAIGGAVARGNALHLDVLDSAFSAARLYRLFMLTVGVDLAAGYDGTAVAWVDWSAAGAKVLDIVLPGDDDAVLKAITAADKAGIDCPLGWPDAFVSFVNAHQAGHLPVPEDVAGPDWRRQLAYRQTDEVVRAVIDRPLLSVAADRISHTAMRCAALLARLAQGGTPVDRCGDGVVVEVYPAASLKLWGLTYQKYKTTANALNLGMLVDALLRSAPWLSLGAHEHVCRRSDHALDAVIAALTARGAWLGLTTRPAEHQIPTARTEGWIAIPIRPIAELYPHAG